MIGIKDIDVVTSGTAMEFPDDPDKLHEAILDRLRGRFLHQPMTDRLRHAVYSEVLSLLSAASEHYGWDLPQDFWIVYDLAGGLAGGGENLLSLNAGVLPLQGRAVEVVPSSEGWIASTDDLFVYGPSCIEALIGLGKVCAAKYPRHPSAGRATQWEPEP